MKNQKLCDILLKKASGYTARESVIEYALKGGVMVVIKKKVTTKHFPPDIDALKMVLNQNVEDLSTLTDEELQKEKVRLLNLLKSIDNKENTENNNDIKQK